MSIFVRLPKLLKIVTRRWSKEKVFVISTVTINFKFFSSSNISIMQLVITCILHDPHWKIHFLPVFIQTPVDSFASRMMWTLSLRQISLENQRKSSVTSLLPEYTLWNCNVRFILYLYTVKHVILSTFQFHMLT